MTSDQQRKAGLSRRGLIRRGALASTLGIAGLSGLSSTVAARRCSHVVPDDYPTIQAAVDAATAGDSICVRGGTYDEQVTVHTAVSLRGIPAPHSSRPATVDGRFTVEADGSSVRRFVIAPTTTFPGGTFPDPSGVLVTASDVTVEQNRITGLTADLGNGQGSFSLHGVQVFGDDGGVSAVTIRDNEIRGFRSAGVPGEWPKYGGIAGVKLQADVEAVTVSGNEVTDHHSAGWVWGVVLTGSASAPGAPADVTVERNHLRGLNDGTIYDVFEGANGGRKVAPYPGSAFGIDGGAAADEATVSRNNLLAPNGAESKDDESVLDATCNWWGTRSGPTADGNAGGEGSWALERGGATIEYSPWLVAPSPSRACVGR